MKKIVICYTVPDTFVFSYEIINEFRDRNIEIIIVSSDEKQLMNIADSLRVSYCCIDFKRAFSVISDLKSLYRLIIFLYNTRPDLIIGATPKAALLSMIAGKLTRVPRRIYHVLGLPFETAVGIKRSVLMAVERITSFCASHIVPVSNSLSEEYLDKFENTKIKMNNFSPLTIAGVDLNRFKRENFFSEYGKLKADLQMNLDSLVIGYVARLTNDKGIGDLINIWSIISKNHSNLNLLVIGERDSRDPFDQRFLDDLFSDKRVVNIPFTREVEKFMSIMDIFVFPSHREGFGNVNVEASAMLLPVISYDVTGCRDSVCDGVSGFLVDKGNILAMVDKIEYLITSESERKSIGIKGREFVRSKYLREKVAFDFVNFCTTL